MVVLGGVLCMMSEVQLYHTVDFEGFVGSEIRT